MNNQLLTVVFLFYENMTALDVVGPHEILGRMPNVIIKRVAEHQGPIISLSSGLILTAEYSLSDITQADILVIPGAGNATSLADRYNILKWIKAIHQTTQYTTSVCTGSLILGAAGLLQGIKATSHWAVLDKIAQWHGIPVNERICTSGKIITSAGVSAGIDMALCIMTKVIDQAYAQRIQLEIEYDPEPPFTTGSPRTAPTDMVTEVKNKLLKKFN